MGNVSDKVVEKIKAHVLCAITFFLSKIVLFQKKKKKYCRAGQATDDNTAHVQCMLDT
jgi:hypothetical protein